MRVPMTKTGLVSRLTIDEPWLQPKSLMQRKKITDAGFPAPPPRPPAGRARHAALEADTWIRDLFVALVTMPPLATEQLAAVGCGW